MVVYTSGVWPNVSLKDLYPSIDFPWQHLHSRVGLRMRAYPVGVVRQKMMKCRCHGYYACVTVENVK